MLFVVFVLIFTKKIYLKKNCATTNENRRLKKSRLF